MNAAIIFGRRSYYVKTFAIFTTKEESSFENELRAGNWYYYKINGSFFNGEQSMLVYNISLQDVKYLCRKYHSHMYVFGTNEGSGLKVHFNVVGSEADDLRTQITRDYKISIPFEVFERTAEQMIDSINEKNKKLNWSQDAMINCISESVDDTLTGKQRYFARTTLMSVRTQ